MGKPSIATRPSLARLKDLDSLPDFSSQLQEARELCNHSARADMILKWTLEKLKKSPEAPSCNATWDVLQESVRILPPERIATLFTSCDLFTIVCRGLQNSKELKSLLLRVASFFNLILQLSNGPNGAALKAFLTSTATDAATFIQVWFDSVYRVAKDTESPAAFITDNQLLDPGFQIWHLRKHTADENAVFARNCLAQVSYLLSLFDGTSTGTLGKRTRDHTGAYSKSTYVSQLESILAKHVFLPARTAFFAAQNATSVSQKKAEYTVDMRAELEFLKAASDKRSSHHRVSRRAFSLLLGIAVRCIPISTPKQRLQEIPWTEEVFSALSNRLGDETSLQSDVLNQMLSVIKRHAILSTATLRELVLSHSGIGNDSGSVDEELISKIVDLDATVFVDEKIVKLLFEYITAVTVREGKSTRKKNVSLDIEEIAARDEIRTLRHDKIVVPIMEAFARDRKLLDFIDLWYNQLHHDRHLENYSIWTNLAPSFAGVMEQSLTEAEVLDMFTQYRKNIKKAKSAPDFELFPSVEMTLAILSSVRSDELRDALFETTQSLFEDLLRLFEKDVLSSNPGKDKSQIGNTWKLLDLTFRNWFPLWASRQNDQKAIGKRGAEIVASEAVQGALAIATAKGCGEITTDDAGAFLVSVCAVFGSYAKCKSDAEDLFQKLLKKAPHIAATALIRCNASKQIVGLKPESLTALIESVQKNIASSTGSLEGLMAILIPGEENKAVCDKLTVSAKEKLHSKQQAADDIDQNTFAMLDSLPVQDLTKEQRRTIINSLTSTVPLVKNETDLNRQLGLLIKFTTHPVYELDIGKDTGLFWALIGSKEQNKKAPRNVFGKPESLELLQYFVKLVMKHLLDDRNTAGRTTVTALARQAYEHASAIKTESATGSYTATLTMIKIVLSAIEEHGDSELKLQCLKLENTESCIDTLLKQAKDITKSPEGSRSAALPWVLDALLHAPWKSISSSKKAVKYQEKFQKVARTILRDELIYEQSESADDEAQKLTLARCFQIVCRSIIADEAPEVDTFAQDTLRVLGARPGPVRYAAVLSSFREATRSLTGANKAKVIDDLLSQEPSSAEVFVLIREVISVVEVPDLEHIKPAQLLHTILQASTSTSNPTVHNRICSCVLLALREKPFMINQYIIEEILQTSQKLIYSATSDGSTYLDICRILTLLLQQHRSRLRDRLHLVLALLTALLSRFFPSKRFSTTPLSARHATSFTRVLQLLCSPPQQRTTRTTTSLIDESRRAQAQVGQYVQYLLHSFCALTLVGPAGEGVRDALRPGLWAVLEAIEVNDADGVKVLSAAMNNSERAVLRSVYEEWRSVGKWKGG